MEDWDNFSLALKIDGRTIRRKTLERSTDFCLANLEDLKVGNDYRELVKLLGAKKAGQAILKSFFQAVFPLMYKIIRRLHLESQHQIPIEIYPIEVEDQEIANLLKREFSKTKVNFCRPPIFKRVFKRVRTIGAWYFDNWRLLRNRRRLRPTSPRLRMEVADGMLIPLKRSELNWIQEEDSKYFSKILSIFWKSMAEYRRY